MTLAEPRREVPPPRVPAELAGPVEVALAKSANDIPGPHALSDGSRYEVKWDGYLY